MKTRMFLFLAFIVLPLSGCVKYSDYWDLTPQAFFRALGGVGESLQETGAAMQRTGPQSGQRQPTLDGACYSDCVIKLRYSHQYCEKACSY